MSPNRVMYNNLLICIGVLLLVPHDGWDFLQNNRIRKSSVAISPQWSMLEEIEFHRLAKLKLDVDDGEDMLVSYQMFP